MIKLAVVWRTSEGEKEYKSPTGWPLTKKAHELAEEFDRTLNRKMHRLQKELRKQGYFRMKPGLPKYHLLGKTLQYLGPLEIRKKCDPDFENVWRALYDYAPKLAPRRIPTSEQRTVGKRNFFLNCYRLGQLSDDIIEKLGNWSNWEDIYMVFAANPRLWEDWERLIGWILKNSEENRKVDRGKLRETLKVFRKVIGKKAKMRRNTTVLTTSELYKLLDSNAKRVP